MGENKLKSVRKSRLKNPHAGEILLAEFLQPMGITQYRLAKETFLPESRISNIVKGKTGITVDTAVRLGKFFGMEPQFWLNLQMMYDIEESMRKNTNINSIKPFQYDKSTTKSIRI